MAKKWLLGRDRFTHINLLNFIRNDSPEDYKNYLRMSDENVQYLIAKVKPLIAKQDTVILFCPFGIICAANLPPNRHFMVLF